MNTNVSPFHLLPLLALLLFVSCDEFAGVQMGSQLPSDIEVASGGSQVGEVGVELGAPVVIRVVDVGGTPLSEVEVAWELVAAGDNGVIDGSVMTDLSGEASATWVLGETAGSQSVRVSVVGFESVTGTVTATAEPGPVTELTVDRDTLHFDALESSTTLATMAVDRFGNAVTEYTVEWLSDEPAIAAVADGTVTSWGNGTTEVSGVVDAAGARVTVVVEQAPAAVRVAEPSYRLTLGDSTAVAAEVSDRNGHPLDATVTWGVGEIAVAEYRDGWVIAQGEGSTTLVATHEELADTATITVSLAAMTVADARAATTGTTVELTGVVTVGTGVLSAQDAYLQDPTAGILIRMAEGVAVAAADSVTVYGVTGVDRQELQVTVDSFTTHGTGTIPDHGSLTLDELNAGGHQGELATLHDVTVTEMGTPDTAGSFEVTVEDAGASSGIVFIAGETGIPTSAFTVGAAYDISGVVSRLDDLMKLKPLTEPDIVERTEPDPFLGCDQVIDHTLGTIVEDTLTSADCASVNRTGSYARYYAFSLASSEDLLIDMTAGFDTYLYLWNRDGSLVDQNDDGGEGTNSKIVQTLGAGDYVIEATSYHSEVTGAFQLETVVTQPPVAAVAISPQADTLQAAGDTTRFTATATDSSGATIPGVSFTWSSSDINVATVDAEGLVTGQGEGSAWIVATAEGVSDSAAVTVTSASAGLNWNTALAPSAIRAEGLYDVWGASATSIYAASHGGRAWHFDGSSWSSIAATSGSPTFRGIWGSAASDVFMVGSDGTIVRYDGSAWTTMSSGTTEYLLDVWGASSSSVFAVGGNGTILHYDGTGWTPMSSGSTAALQGVWGTSATDVYAVGSSGTILHYDGTGWTAMSSGSTVTLRGVWGASATDVFAVGQSGTILHYDGTAWAAQSSGVSDELSAIWGSSGSNVIAGGTGVILHYDGTTWTAAPRKGGNVWSLWGSSSSNVVGVGQQGLVVRYNGSTWSYEESAPSLDGIWASSASDVYAVGFYGELLHHDGVTWSRVAAPDRSRTWNFADVWGASSSDVFVVGHSGAIIHYDGVTWTDHSVSASHLRAVWGASATDVFVVGVGGRIFHYDGASWTEMASGTTEHLNDVWGTSATDVYAVGQNGTVLHYDGTSWSPMATGSATHLYGVHGHSAHLFATGAAGEVLHYDGTTWNSLHTGSTQSLQDAWAFSATDLYVLAGNAILHWDGSDWTPGDIPSGTSLRTIWAVGPQDVWVAGSPGTVYRGTN